MVVHECVNGKPPLDSLKSPFTMSKRKMCIAGSLTGTASTQWHIVHDARR